MRRKSLVFLVLLCEPDISHARWLHYPTPATPRTRDGKPNLAAKAPRRRMASRIFPESGSPSMHL